MRPITLLSILLFSLLVHAQVEQELVYPVVPIADKCHTAFDDTTSIRIMSKVQFESLGGIWIANNNCLGYPLDTQYAASFNTLFIPLNTIGGGQPVFVHDGDMNNEYTGIKEKKSSVKPFTKVHFTDIQFEKDGAMYQVPNFTVFIDSIVVPELDTCWQYFPMNPVGEFSTIDITKEKLKKLLTDSFGYTKCNNTAEWPDTSVSIKMTLAPRAISQGMSVNVFIDTYRVNTLYDFTKAFKQIDSLGDGDNIIFRKEIYLKNGKYFYSPEYRFKIAN